MTNVDTIIYISDNELLNINVNTYKLYTILETEQGKL
jgi:hypothetical protein